MLLGQEPELDLDKFIVRFYANSDVQKEWLNKNVRSELEGFLQHNLHNSKVNMRFELQGEDIASDNSTPYTAQEKFNFMLEKSEALRMMREVFGLKTD